MVQPASFQHILSAAPFNGTCLYAALYRAGPDELNRILAQDTNIGKNSISMGVHDDVRVQEDLRYSYDFCRKELAGVTAFQKALRKECRILQRVTTPMGRVRWLPDLALSTDSGRYRRAARQALHLRARIHGGSAQSNDGKHSFMPGADGS